MKKITALAAMLAIPALAAPAGYFQVPGTETTMKIYGKAETWGYYAMDNGGGFDVATGTATDQSWNEKNVVDSVTYARFGFQTTTPSSFGDVTTKLELEGKSAGTTTSWGAPFRIRHAYGQFAGLTIGQTNSLYVDWQYCPAYNDTWNEDFAGNSYRQRQIRYDFQPTKDIKLGVALEMDRTKGNTTKLGNAFAAAFNFSQDWGFVTVTALYQKKEDSTLVNGGTPANTRTKVSGTGTSFTVGGAWNITANDQIGFRMIKGGDQGGSSVWGLPDGFYADGSSYSFYKSTSMDLGYSHTWNDQFNTNLGIGQITFPKDTTAGYGEKVTVSEFFINTNWNVTKNATFGFEYFDTTAKEADFNIVQKVDGTFTNKAHNNGFNVMFQYRFF